MRLSHSTREYLTRVASLDVDGLTSWREWCDANRDELERLLGRQFLKLKFSPRESVPPLHEHANIGFDRELLTTLLLDAATGWTARPIDVFGVRGLYAEGRDAEADSIIARDIATKAASEDAGRRLGELVMDAEWLHRKHETRYALGIARAIAALTPRDDLLDPAIADARAFLRRIEPR